MVLIVEIATTQFSGFLHEMNGYLFIEIISPVKMISSLSLRSQN